MVDVFSSPFFLGDKNFSSPLIVLTFFPWGKKDI